MDNKHYSLQEVIRLSVDFMKKYFIVIFSFTLLFFLAAFFYLKDRPSIFDTNISSYSLVIGENDLNQHVGNLNQLLKASEYSTIESSFNIPKELASKIKEISVSLTSIKKDAGTLAPNNQTDIEFVITHERIDAIDSLVLAIESFTKQLPDLQRKQAVLRTRIENVQSTLDSLKETEVDFNDNADKIAYTLSKASASEATYTLLTLINAKELESYSEIIYIRRPIIQGLKDVSKKNLKYLIATTIGFLLGIIISFVADSLRKA